MEPGSVTPLSLLRATPRIAAVVDVLRRHGFGEVLSGGGAWPAPQRVREAFEELGPVFVKFGQMLSTRGDLLPASYTEELARLQDRVPPIDPGLVEQVIESELGTGPSDVFLRFDREPLASASIAQVHGAVTDDGTEVVVKVMRPGLDERVAEDVAVLSQIATVLDITVPRLKPYDMPALMRDFQRSMEAELDFTKEAVNVGRFVESMRDEPGVWVPQVIPALSGRRVITMEHSHGVRLDAYVAGHAGEASALARRVGEIFVHQVFRDGLFHADPHPGNLFVMPDGRICLHDFGMIGELDEPMREALVSLLEATLAGDVRRATTAYLDLGLAPSNVDRKAVEAAVAKVVADIRGRPLAEVSVGRALQAVATLGVRHRIRNPGSFMLLSRAFITLEGVLAHLDPNLSFVEVFGSALDGGVGRRMAADRLRRDAGLALRAMDRLIREAPDDVRGALRRWADGSLGRVIIARDGDDTLAEERTVRAGRRLLAGGFLALTGALLLPAGPEVSGWVGLALLVVGVGVLLAYLLRP